MEDDILKALNEISVINKYKQLIAFFKTTKNQFIKVKIETTIKLLERRINANKRDKNHFSL